MPNNFTYTTGIPNPPNNPSTDAPNMQTNTNSINSLISIDHVGFNTNGSGIHKQVTLSNQAAPGLGDGTGVLYANLINANSWPVWQNAAGTTPLISILTAASANGYCSLVGGVILQWGTVSFSGGNDHETGTVSFATSNINFPSSCFVVIPQLQVASSSETVASNTIAIRSKSSTQFIWVFNSSSSSGSTRYPGFYWIAIGN
jgi:hypothetical protein